MPKQLAPGPWVVIDTKELESKHGGTYWNITLANTRGDLAHTHAVPEHRNWRNWREVVGRDQLDRGTIIDDLHYKTLSDGSTARDRRNEPIIDADSTVKILHREVSKQAVLDRLAEVLENSKENSYTAIFDN